jgi:hypothetical protein
MVRPLTCLPAAVLADADGSGVVVSALEICATPMSPPNTTRAAAAPRRRRSTPRRVVARRLPDLPMGDTSSVAFSTG